MIGLRSITLDKVRGLAVLLMLVDHAVALSGHGVLLRIITRAAMPLFFLIAGHLATRVNGPRLCVVGLVGVLLGQVVPWLDAPNVLAVYAVAVPVIVWLRSRPGWSHGFAALSLTFAANGWILVRGCYDPLCLIGLMAVGSTVSREWFAWGGVLPDLFAYLGRFPLSVYVGHVVLFSIVGGV